MARSRRWLPVLVAVLGSTVLAVGFGVTANALVSPAGQAQPRLKTISPSLLAQLGLTLQAAPQPPYCGVTDTAVGRAWLPPGSIDCAISRSRAESAALGGAGAQSGKAVDSVLARVTSSRGVMIGRDRLAWVVVVQRTVILCVPGGVWTQCPVPGGFHRTQVVVVDGRTSTVLDRVGIFVGGLPLTPRHGRPGGALTVPVPGVSRPATTA